MIVGSGGSSTHSAWRLRLPQRLVRQQAATSSVLGFLFNRAAPESEFALAVDRISKLPRTIDSAGPDRRPLQRLGWLERSQLFRAGQRPSDCGSGYRTGDAAVTRPLGSADLSRRAKEQAGFPQMKIGAGLVVIHRAKCCVLLRSSMSSEAALGAAGHNLAIRLRDYEEAALRIQPSRSPTTWENWPYAWRR